MKAIFVTDFDHALPRWPDAEGRDQLTCASRIGQVRVEGVQTNVVQLEGPDAVIEAIKLDPRYLFVEEVEDA